MDKLFIALGVLSAIIFLLGDIPYILDTLRGKTKPQRVTWGIVFLLNSIGFANQYASGATNSLWLFGAAVFATGLIFLLSLKRGVGGYAKLDIFSMLAAAVGLILWVVFKSPIFSILANLLVAVVALIPTIVKARKDPESETKIAWLAGAVSAALASLSVGQWNFALLILPVASTILQASIAYLLYFPAKQKIV